MKKYLAEMLGTMVLVLMGCGSAIFNGGCGTTAQVLTVAFAFGLSVVAMVYAIGNISGCHINPAITIGCFLAGRISGKDAFWYVVFQILGGIFASLILWVLVKGIAVDATTTGANDFTCPWWAAFIAETIFTCIFVLVVLGVTDSKKGNSSLAGLAIGLTLVLIHIVCIPITGTSVNPARSIGPALFEGGSALSHLWLFIVAPALGGALSAWIWKGLSCECEVTGSKK